MKPPSPSTVSYSCNKKHHNCIPEAAISDRTATLCSLSAHVRPLVRNRSNGDDDFLNRAARASARSLSTFSLGVSCLPPLPPGDDCGVCDARDFIPGHSGIAEAAEGGGFE